MSDESPRPDTPGASPQPMDPGPSDPSLEPPPILPPPFAPAPVTPPPNPPPHFAPPPNAPPPHPPQHFAPPPVAAPQLESPVATFPESVAAHAPRARHGFPVAGASLWIFGALLWAYVVMGEWVIRFELPEALAVLVVLAATAIAWFSATRHQTKRPQQLAPAALGIGLFVATLVVSMIFSSHRRSIQEAIAVLLWFFSAGIYFLGRYLTARPREVRTRGRAAATVVFWLLSGLGTIASVVSTLSH